MNGMLNFWDFLTPKVATVGDFVFFRLIEVWLDNKIENFGQDLLGRTMALVSAVALVLVTLWVLMIGYQIVAGKLQESFSALVMRGAKVVVIVAIASGVAFTNKDFYDFFTRDLDKAVHAVFTGEDDKTTESAIDKNLAYTQVAFTAIDSIQTVGVDKEAQQEKWMNIVLSGAGTAGPPIMAGTMLLFFKVMMAFFVGLGPIFIMCLIFDATKELFKRWLHYGIGLLFSMAALSVISSWVLDLTSSVAEGYWGAFAIKKALDISTEGVTSLAMQQGFIGLIMTLLIVSVPPAVAYFIGGPIGNFMAYSAFNAGQASPGPQGQPPGSTHSVPPPANQQLPTEVKDTGGFAQQAGLRGVTASSAPPSDIDVKRKG